MKRVNVKLVTILFVALFVGTAGLYAIYRFQKSRQTGGLLRIAEQKLVEDRTEDAVRHLLIYTRRQKDDLTQVNRLATVVRDYISKMQQDGTLDGKRFREAYSVLDECARRAPNDVEVQETMINVSLAYNFNGDAIDYLERLIERQGDKAKPIWRLQLAQAYHRSANYEKSVPLLEQLVGWNAADETFDVEKALAPSEVDAYSALATILRDQRQSPRQADMVIDQMMRQNADDFRSYVARIHYWQSGINPPEEAIDADILKALSLAPNEVLPLVLAGQQALKNREFVRAQALFSQARELHPKFIEPIFGLFECARMQGDNKKALSYADDWLKANPGNPAGERVLFFKASLLLDIKDFTEFEQTFDEYQRIAGGRPTVEFLRGRRHVVNGEWLTGSRILSEVRHQLQLSNPYLLDSVDRHLASAYANLGQLDRQLESLNNILQYKPDDVQIRAAAIQCMYALKQDSKAMATYEALERELASAPDIAKTWTPIRAHLEIELQKRLPESSRNWAKAEALVREVVDLPNVDQVYKRGLTAELLRASGRGEQARDVLADADLGDTNNALVRLGNLGQRARELPLDEAMTEIDEFEKENGVSLATLALRAETIALRKPDDARERLAALEKAGDSVGASEKLILWTELSKYYLLAGHPAEAQRLWDAALANNPNDVQTYMRIVEVASAMKDTEGMGAILRRMEEHLGGDAAEVNWARAILILTQFYREEVPASQLDIALTMVSEAKKVRSGWPNLFLVEGDIRIAQGRNELALESFERARQLGSNSPTMLQVLARIYFEQQRPDDARAILDELPRQYWTEMEERMDLYLLARKGELPEEIDIEKTGTTAQEFVAVSRILVEAKRGDDAERALRRALELEPGSPVAWSTLFLKKFQFDGPEEARALLDVAKDQVDERSRASFMGTSYRILRDFDAAEPFYQENVAKAGDNVMALQDIATFYIEFNKYDQAVPFIERILKDQEPHDPSASNSVRWARRMLALNASRGNDYEGYRQAVELIEQNAPVGAVLEPDDLVLLGQLTKQRPELPSHQNLLEQLTKASRARKLNLEEQLLLAESSFAAGDWPLCESTMSDLLGRNPNDIRVLDPWLRFLLQRGDLQAAGQWAENCPANSMAALRTRVHLDVRRGHPDRAIETLKQILRLGETPEQQQEQLRLVATLAQELGPYDPKMFDAAESSWKRLASMNPSFKLAYAQFLLDRHDPAKIDAIMALSKELYDNGQQPLALRIATVALTGLPKSTPNRDKHIAQLGSWLDSVDPTKMDSSDMVAQRAEFEALNGRPERQEQILLDYLSKNTKKDRSRGFILNNIAYILAMKGKGEEAQRHIDAAVEILGPVATLHDTIGVVRLARGDAAGAVTEFQKAIDQGQTSPVVYLHLAVAHWKAGNKEGATEAFLKGQEIGLEEDALSLWEQPMLKQLVQDMKDAGVSLERAATPVNASAATAGAM